MMMIAGTPYLNFLCRVLWCQTFIPSQAPILPPSTAINNNVASGILHFDFFAFHLSTPYMKKVTTFIASNASKLERMTAR